MAACSTAVPLGLVSAAGVIVSGDQALVENTKSGLIRSEDAASAAVELNVQEFAGAPAADLSARLENSGLIRSAGIAILGGAGQETVINHGRIVGDVVLGDGADSFVFGKGGTLAGDLLLGDGDDLVLIENGAGKISIADFSAAGGDVVDVSAFFSSFEELAAHSKQCDGDVLIKLDHNDSLMLANLQLTVLSAGEFVFS